MKGDYCRFCGFEKLNKSKRDIYLSSQKKTIKGISVWTCENCGEEFLDDASASKLYRNSRAAKREKSIAS